MISFLQPNITYHVNWLDGRIINTQYVNHKRFEVFNQALLVKLFWSKCGHFSAFLLSVFRASHMFLCSSYKKAIAFFTWLINKLKNKGSFIPVQKSSFKRVP